MVGETEENLKAALASEAQANTYARAYALNGFLLYCILWMLKRQS
jgi:hypothetical protein